MSILFDPALTFYPPAGANEPAYRKLFADAFAEAERHFGASSQILPLGTIKFCPRAFPWMPPNNGVILVVELPDWCQSVKVQLELQVSHEVFHIFSGCGNNRATGLEEGMATWFSEQYVKNAVYAHPSTKYAECRDAFCAMMNQYPNAILTLRKQQPVISQINFPLLQATCPKLSLATLKLLADPF